jgi:hypothetical protein
MNIINILISPTGKENNFSLFPFGIQIIKNAENEIETLENLTKSFLISLCGGEHPEYDTAQCTLKKLEFSAKWKDIVNFYLTGIALIPKEINKLLNEDPTFTYRLDKLERWVKKSSNLKNQNETTEQIWHLFFPEANGILKDAIIKENTLRKKRTIRITKLNNNAISDPAKEILFTSNVLLTVPLDLDNLEDLHLSNKIKQKIIRNKKTAQHYWYDHPIPMGVNLQNNEVLYGLRGLDETMDFEKKRGNVSLYQKLTCVLSVSVTHDFLHEIAKEYLENEINQYGGFRNLDVYIFTEEDTARLTQEILIPAARYYLKSSIPERLFDCFGVDGEYGRHYSFLKAFSAFWSILIDKKIKATFKTDLDQVFPQKELVKETFSSAFEHFRTELWGAEGIDSCNKPVELGMIAGALVNEKDIHQSVFTPDVSYPDGKLDLDEYFFFSKLPQALSTVTEMVTRYNTPDLDGKSTCIQRIHVTGGTTGILVNSLRQFRPFTPSFFGRAEDQAYLLSTIGKTNSNLVYLHKDGLIMRHDKESFAQESINASQVGKLIGDYIRVLYFSAYARVIDKGTFRCRRS